MNVQSYFDAFLGKISLGQTQIDRIKSASDTLITFLSDRYELTTDDVFLQGSYANGTAVKPVDGGEYDVDIVCICASEDQTAEDAIDSLYDVLESHGRYKGRLKPKQPCIRIEYADDEIGQFHVDVVPVRPCQTDDEAPLDAPRKASGWHATAPNEYTTWCEQQGAHFRQTVQMLKRWRDEHQNVRGAIKSIVLQVLISEHLPAFASNDAERVAQTILGLHNVLSKLDAPPAVWNPVLKSENLAARWTSDSFRNFKRELAEAAELVTTAVQTEDLIEAIDSWRGLFGEAFPAVAKDVFAVELADWSHAKSPETRGWYEYLDPRYKVSIRAWSQLGKRGRRAWYPNDGPLLFTGRYIEFKADRSGPTGASVWWRVTNTGNHARVKKGLRGDFLQAQGLNDKLSSDPERHWETTAYTGTHLVEVFLVVGTRVVARSEPFKVNIYNRQFYWRP
ncbi:SMODS domain-containing nucleotidyltransferase [Nocardia farcinica]|uniref:SMODS domain-containing nucleotidyltransferase n=1 Tax=Nocardia farcinica TaxID=37329 RepID=UPI002458468D|nr:nucleotidyltransferase [Nocardia farcinica]